MSSTFDFDLIGHGVFKDDCGSYRSRRMGCLDVEAHNSVLDSSVHGHVYIRRAYVNTCFRADCPICYPKWVSRATRRAVHRLQHFSLHVNYKNPIHVILSPPFEVLKKHSSFGGLRRKCVEIAKSYGIQGGSLVFHSKSRRCLSCGSNMLPRKNRCHKCGSFGWKWVFNPHFHCIGFGWLVDWNKGGKDLYSKYGWVVKNLKVRKTIAGTVWYELSHCAYLGSRKTIVLWFGDMNYKNFKCPPIPEKKDVCAICGQELQAVVLTAKFSDFELPQATDGYYLPEMFRYRDEPPEDMAVTRDEVWVLPKKWYV